MLNKFRAAKQGEIDALIRAQDRGELPAPLPSGVRATLPGFGRALRDRGPGAVIAEFKQASPSRGDINLSLTPEGVADMYAASGAAAISVLTEEVYFKGSLEFLDRMKTPGLPLLRKDFLFHPLQVHATAATPASALLLIARMFDTAAELRDMRELTEELGMDAVVEVFDARDLDVAREAGSGIIQVNNRDLDKLTTDLGNSRTLSRGKAAHETWISASGIFTPEEVREMAELGFDAVLVGTSLMQDDDPGAALLRLTEAAG